MNQAVPETPATSQVGGALRSRKDVIPLSTVFSVLAVLVSLGTAVSVYSYDPLGPQVDRYDFTTPKASLLSESQMIADGDWMTLMALRFPKGDRHATEMIQTLRVHREREWRGTKLLFISYDRDGVPKYDVRGCEKDASTGMWKSSSITYSLVGAALSGSEEDVELSKMVTSWRENGEFE